MRSFLFAATALALAAPVAAQSDGVVTARAYREAHEAEILREYVELLSMPNVASDAENIARNADYLASALRAHGATAEIWKRPGTPPSVYGELLVPGATRTIGIYVHFDGQPAGDLSSWTNDPWRPTLYTRALNDGGTRIELPAPGTRVDPDWRIYARSASDDKAPLGALFPVLRALRERGLQPTSNLKFLFEGEEEAGSAGLGGYLEEHRAKLDDIDVWLFFDGPVHQSGRPQLVFGVRGVTGFSITTYGPTRPLHSGHYGSWAPVPGQLLAELIATFKDDDGRVLIPGFYETVAPLGEEERAALRSLPRYDDELRRELGLATPEGNGADLSERLLLPSLTVLGLSSGNTGANARNIIPSTATASFDIRLVRGNDPEHMIDLVEAHMRAQGWHIVREDPDIETRMRYPKIARVDRGQGYPAARTPMNTPIAQTVAEAARAAAGPDLLMVPGLGGSLPIYLFTDVLAKPVIIVPIANHDNNQHAADENIRVGNLWYGMELYGALLRMQ